MNCQHTQVKWKESSSHRNGVLKCVVCDEEFPSASTRECPSHKVDIPEDTQECFICVAQDEKNDALSLLASATDFLNSWARETHVTEARTEADIKAVVNRLWSSISARLSRLEAETVILR